MLSEQGVLTAAAAHVEAGRAFHFASTIPARHLEELVDRARRSDSITSFLDDWLTIDLGDAFDKLSRPAVYGSPERAYKILQGIYLHVTSENDLVVSNADLSFFLLDGAAPELAAAALGSIAWRHLGVRLDRRFLESRLADFGLHRIPLGREPELVRALVSSESGSERSEPSRTTLSWDAEDPPEPALIVGQKSLGWEYMLLAAVIFKGLVELKPFRLQFNAGFAAPAGQLLSSKEAVDVLSAEFNSLERIIKSTDRLMSSYLQRALGDPGVAGDADMIISAGEALVASYKALLDWAQRVRSYNVPRELHDVVDLEALFASGAIPRLMPLRKICSPPPAIFPRWLHSHETSHS